MTASLSRTCLKRLLKVVVEFPSLAPSPQPAQRADIRNVLLLHSKLRGS